MTNTFYEIIADENRYGYDYKYISITWSNCLIKQKKKMFACPQK